MYFSFENAVSSDTAFSVWFRWYQKVMQPYFDTFGLYIISEYDRIGVTIEKMFLQGYAVNRTK